MRSPITPTGVLLRLIVFTGLIAVLLAGVVVAIQRPVSGHTRDVEALFTDVSGLRTNDDVRMFGVAVGKVVSIDLEGNLARVKLRTQQDRPIFQSSTLAIRYQNLTGQRYLDIKQPSRTDDPMEPGSIIGTANTIPSFDITTLFNGMEPVLAEFSPEALNQFMSNAIAVVEGDGSKVGLTLDSIQKLSGYVSDQQAVISLLLRNFEQVFQMMDGKSPEMATLIQGISEVFVNLQKQVEGLIDFVNVAPSVLGPLNSLLARLGLSESSNPDLQDLLRRVFPEPQTAVDELNRLPGLLQSLAATVPPVTRGVDMNCARGAAELPAPLAVLIQGKRVSVCNE